MEKPNEILANSNPETKSNPYLTNTHTSLPSLSEIIKKNSGTTLFPLLNSNKQTNPALQATVQQKSQVAKEETGGKSSQSFFSSQLFPPSRTEKTIFQVPSAHPFSSSGSPFSIFSNHSSQPHQQSNPNLSQAYSQPQSLMNQPHSQQEQPPSNFIANNPIQPFFDQNRVKPFF